MYVFESTLPQAWGQRRLGLRGRAPSWKFSSSPAWFQGRSCPDEAKAKV